MRTLVILVLSIFAASAQSADKLSGTNVDVRTSITFKVSDAAVQRLVPEGWEISTPPAGPAKGFNLAVVLIDSISAQDAGGKAVVPLRSAVLVIPAKKKGSDAGVSMVVYGISVREGAPGAYGVYVAGEASIERKVHSITDGKSNAEETWTFRASDGNAIEAKIQYERGATTQSKLEARVYSGAKPEFFRIYRWEQVAEVVRSTAMDVDRVSKISFKATGSRLAPLFDGSEQIISVMSIPSYSRTVFLPE